LNPWLVNIVISSRKEQHKTSYWSPCGERDHLASFLNPIGVVSFSGGALAAGICDIITPTGAGEEDSNMMLAILVKSESLTLILIVISLSFFIITSTVLLL
jgi:hypothetical protein